MSPHLRLAVVGGLFRRLIIAQTGKWSTILTRGLVQTLGNRSEKGPFMLTVGVVFGGIEVDEKQE